jgi:hypothetical protein
MEFPFQSDDETDAASSRIPLILAICLGCVLLLGSWGLWKAISGRQEAMAEPQVPVVADVPKQDAPNTAYPVASPPPKASSPQQQLPKSAGRRNTLRSSPKLAHQNQHPVPYDEQEFFDRLRTAKSSGTGKWLKFTKDYWHNTVSDWGCSFESVLFTTPGSRGGIVVSFYPYAHNPYVIGVCSFRPGVDSSKFADYRKETRLRLIHGTIESIDQSGNMQFSDCEFKLP